MAIVPARGERRADRLTLALAGGAAAAVGAVIVGHLARLTRRRVAEASADEGGGLLESTEHALGAATKGTQDVVTVAIEGYTAGSRRETILFNLLTGFTGAFALMRLSTWGIRSGWWPASNVRVRGRHVHHFIPGILVAFAAGGTALITEGDRVEQALAFPFGAGVGMTFDEAALLLELEDVYWSPKGLLSLQLSFGVAAVLGATILGLRLLSRGERESEQAGLIPDETGEFRVPEPA